MHIWDQHMQICMLAMQRGYGATAARLTPDQKVGSSNLSALIYLYHSYLSMYGRDVVPPRQHSPTRLEPLKLEPISPGIDSNNVQVENHTSS